jgi:soluble lytic murein transglycosylase
VSGADEQVKTPEVRRTGRLPLRPVVAGILLAILLAVLFTPSFWRTVYPIRYQPQIAAGARAAHVDPLLVAAIVRVESHFREDDVSHAGAIGLMQLMPTTASWVAGRIGLRLSGTSLPHLSQPALNVRLGAYYLAYLLQTFQGNLPEAVAAYNAGPNRVEQWLRAGVWSGDEIAVADIPVRETRHFVWRVMYTYEVYQRFY